LESRLSSIQAAIFIGEIMGVLVWTPERITEVKKMIEDYTEETHVPTIAGFCSKNKIRKQRLYEIEELREALEFLIYKKENVLELGALSNQMNASMVIFSLKQMGWRDRFEIEHTGRIEISPKEEKELAMETAYLLFEDDPDILEKVQVKIEDKFRIVNERESEK
jgi:hypothetical protein